MPGENCFVCNRKVAKTAKALRCSRCRDWYHVSCAELEEDDFLFLGKRGKAGFRWYCADCVVDADDAVSKAEAACQMDKKFENMESVMSDFMEKLGERIAELEQKCGAVNSQAERPDMEPVKFAEIVKKTLQEGRESGVVVNDRGQKKTVEHQNVLVIKPKSGADIADADMSDSANEIEEALEQIQVSSCNKIKSGGLVVRFPNEKAMIEASRAIGTRLGPGHAMQDISATKNN